MPILLDRGVSPLITDKATAYEYIVRSLLPSPRQHGSTPTLMFLNQYIGSQSCWRLAIGPDSLLTELEGIRVSLVNSDAIRDYLIRHADLPEVASQTAGEIRQSLPDVPMALELVLDPEDAETETLILYLRPPQVESSFFSKLREWNTRLAEHLASSQAWFLVNLDLRRTE